MLDSLNLHIFRWKCMHIWENVRHCKNDFKNRSIFTTRIDNIRGQDHRCGYGKGKKNFYHNVRRSTFNPLNPKRPSAINNDYVDDEFGTCSHGYCLQIRSWGKFNWQHRSKNYYKMYATWDIGGNFPNLGGPVKCVQDFPSHFNA